MEIKGDMLMETKSLKLRLSFLYLIIYSTLACYYPFLTLYFQQRGIAYYKIGFLFGTSSLISIIFQLIWGILSDKYFGKRNTIFFLTIASSLAIMLFLFSKSFISILLSIVIFMIFQSPIIPITDAYCYEIIEQNRKFQFGTIRLMGSIGYAISVILVGIAVKKMGVEFGFICYIAFIMLSLIILKSINFKGKKAGAQIDFNDITKLFKNKKFVLLVLSGMFASLAMGANGNYISILIQKTGGDVSKLGIVWFVIAISELPMLFVGNKLMKKVGVLNFYIIGLVFFTIRFFLNSICTFYITVILIQLMQSITFPMYLLSTNEYINTSTSSKIKTSAFTAFSALAGGLGALLGSTLGGFILQVSNIFVLYKLLSLSCLISTVIALILKKL